VRRGLSPGVDTAIALDILVSCVDQSSRFSAITLVSCNAVDQS